ncbi:hypothetical protein [Microbacterium rhizosphaerae]|uniref:Tfp pilus assembly protein PilO n=1 Tax=Microbacterium rhizosphaerae TaxID=1678237 RepID=A0ABZ0SR58_9MICO|nr:hypothetical protein [Microbacterium rhizosphaerae]WPR91153.1 hypothetical protein SM116_07670 [Microbacterium rhizosphaerae]
MPKQIINLIGILVSVAVLALGIFLVAMPLVTQALGVNAQADQVSHTNVLYQAQVDALNKAKQNKSATDAAVATLRVQIPAAPQLDDVFDVVARASESSGATIATITAGTQTAFVVRTGPTTLSEEKATSNPTPAPSATASGTVGDAQQAKDQSNAQTAQTNAATGATSAAGGQTATGQTRTQIDFAITIKATDMNQVTAFLDGLRAGPRLLSNITSTVTQNGTGIQANVTALTFVDGVTAPTTKGAK